MCVIWFWSSSIRFFVHQEPKNLRICNPDSIIWFQFYIMCKGNSSYWVIIVYIKTVNSRHLLIKKTKYIDTQSRLI